MIHRICRSLLAVCLTLSLLVGLSSLLLQGRVAPAAARSTAATRVGATIQPWSTQTAPATVHLPPCKGLNSSKDLLSGQKSGLSTIEQAYRCLLRHYIAGKHLDHRTLLRGAYNETLTFLNTVFQNALSDLTLGTLTGDANSDWQTFAQAYTAVDARLLQAPQAGAFLAQTLQAPTGQEALAQLCLTAMTDSLHDDHTTYAPPSYMKELTRQLFDEGAAPSFGLITSPITDTTTVVYITDIFPNSPAAQAGLLPGDVIKSVNGKSPVGLGSEPLIVPQLGKPAILSVQRPATGAQLTATLSPRSMVTPDTTARVLPGNIGYVKLYSFTEHAYARVMGSMRGLGLGASARGLVLDLRGNGGGVEEQAVQLISAFIHHTTLSYAVDGKGHRDALTTDDKIPLLHLPLVVLIDGGSGSSSELVADAVRDLHLGKLVGERSAGDINSAGFYGLSDGGGLEITEQRVLGAKGEAIDHVGIAPDVQAPLTAAALSAGNDPAISQAEALLQR